MRVSSARSCALGALFFSGALVGCGANVVYVGEGEGGEGGDVGDGGRGGSGGAPTTTTATTTTTTTTTGGGPNLELVDEVEISGESDVVVTVQPGTLGITTVSTTKADPFAEIYMTRLTAPSGAVVVDGSLPSNGWYWASYGILGAATPQVSHPETFPLAPGSWTFHFSSATPAEVDVWRRATVDGNFHGGVLDINLFLPKGVIADFKVAETLAQAYDDWGGIELGEVRIFDLSDEYLVVDDSNLYALVAETSVAQNRPALNVMATLSIEGSFADAAGFALGVPGVGVVHGTNASAVVWEIQTDSFDSIILRHEAGHFAGLFHTTEYEVGLADPLDDTPECDDVLALYESCPDFDYVMFPSGGSGAGLFSSGEARVLQASALYRGSFAPGEPPFPPFGPELDGSAPGQGRRVPPEVVQAAKQRARAHRAQLVAAPAGLPTLAGAWSTHVSPQAAAHLAGIGCPSPGGASFLRRLASLGAVDAAQLLEIGADDAAPPRVRRRALRMIAALGEVSLEIADALELIARDEGDEPVVRAAALRALAAADDERGVLTALDLDADAHPLVRRTALSLE